jgi:5-methylcytosine-specific restriction endonuclease McrA
MTHLCKQCDKQFDHRTGNNINLFCSRDCAFASKRPDVGAMIGRMFGQLTVIGPASPSSDGRVRVLCRCGCGVVRSVDAGGLKGGTIASCGCMRRDAACIICGVPFVSIRKQQCCSDECRQERKTRAALDEGKREQYRQYYYDGHPLVIRNCLGCGAEFGGERTRGRRSMVCPKCRADKWMQRQVQRAIRFNAPFQYFVLSDVFARYGRKCWICGKEITEGFGSNRQSMTIDHVVPLSQGGEHVLLNVRPAHQRCNSTRGDGTGPRGTAGNQNTHRAALAIKTEGAAGTPGAASVPPAF